MTGGGATPFFTIARDGLIELQAELGADPDTLVASAKAYLGALNKLLARGARTHAQHSAQ